MANLIPYNREKAIEYANTWAYGRNPAYYDYSNLGGDCTNFISQCLYAGGGIMNYAKTWDGIIIMPMTKLQPGQGFPIYTIFLPEILGDRVR